MNHEEFETLQELFECGDGGRGGCPWKRKAGEWRRWQAGGDSCGGAMLGTEVALWPRRGRKWNLTCVWATGLGGVLAALLRNSCTVSHSVTMACHTAHTRLA